ncbi:MAG: peptidylprolyl isomerase [Anaerolineae bacterium]|nr:peptidylprolyl isomerase [Anaerolineae bacterium]
MAIDVSKHYTATIVTAHGEIVAQLFADRAPKTVNSFVFLARQGFYDGLTFHRVVPGFVAQGGDPLGTGAGGPGYQFEDEIDEELKFDSAGLLAMANSGPDTNGSQFFITYAPTPWLNGQHTIFGRVVAGMEVAEKLTPRNPDEDPSTPGDAIQTVRITEG